MFPCISEITGSECGLRFEEAQWKEPIPVIDRFLFLESKITENSLEVVFAQSARRV